MHFVTDKSKVPIFLLRMAYAAVPEEVTRRLLQIVDADSERHGYFLCSERVDAILDSRLASALTAKLREDTLKPEALRGLLSFLLGKGVDEARQWAEAEASPATTDLDTLVAVASALLTQTPDVSWSTIWPLMERDVAFGRALLEKTSYADPTHSSFTRGLTDVQLGQLYIWTVGQYPYQETADRGYGMMSPHDTIRFLRDGALEQLKKRASFSACDCLATAIIRFPQYSWLRYHLDEAEALACASTWQALPVPNLLQVCSDPSRRSVESSSQLLEVICESLDRLQVLLHAELPAVRDLWNSKNGEAWPKEEEDVSDYIARHFKADLIRRGIVVNREVQIRKGQPGEMPGQKTDIHVDANVPGTRTELYGPVSVIVEVKGNWNAGLMEDLERQLRDRYLQNNPCGTGLYLVAYFSAKTWSKDDPRRGKAAAVTAEELRRSLETQAASLSGALHLKSYVLDATLGSTAAQP